MQKKQEEARKTPRPGATEQQTALLSLQELALGLTDLFGELWMKMQLSSFLAAARSLALHHTHHTFKGLSQPPQLLYLPSAAAAAGAPGRSSSDGGAAAAAAAGVSSLGGVSPIKSSSQHTMYLAMPNLQLPPYMLLLASGQWCGNAPAGSGSAKLRAAAAAASSLPSCAAALGPTLCMSFPRRRVVGESRDCLLLVLCDAQGLAGPVLKRIRVPVSCYSSVGALAAAAASAGGDAAAAAAAAGQQRKRKRDDDAAAAGSVGTPQDEQQQQQDQRQQQQRQPRIRGLLLQPEEHAAELGAAVRWCQSRLTFERVKMELEALQLEVEEVQLLRLPSGQLLSSGQVPAAAAAAAAASPQQQQQQQVWQQPEIRLLGMPGVQLFQQLQRKPGCVPSSLGLQEVWFSTGPEYGQWRMHVRGSFYHQTSAAAGAEGSTAAAPAVVDGLAKQQQQQQQQGPADVYEYDLRAGDSVRCAVLQLLRIVHMQLFLNRLESLAWGAQSLQVVQVGSSSSSSSMGFGVAALQASSGSTPAAAAAGGDADVDMVEADGSGGGVSPPAKRLKQQQQQQQQQHDGVGSGSATAAAAAGAGVGLANGVSPHSNGTSGSGLKPSSNGQLADGDKQQQHMSLTHSPAAAAAAAAGTPTGIASSSSPYGLLFHWAGTGLVRLAQYSCSTALLECGAPLQPLASSGSSSSSHESSRQRLQFAVQWQPRFEFTTHNSYSSSSGSSTAGLSSSTTTTRVDVRPSAVASASGSTSAAAGSGSSSGWARGKAASAQDVLDVACSMQCNAQHVPADLLNELCDMVNSGCIDLLLDGLSLLAWPLAGVAAAFAAPVQPAAQLSTLAGPLQAAGELAGKLGVASCRTVSSCAVSGPYHVRYRVEWQQQQEGAALVAVSSTAGAPSAAAAAAHGLVLELLFACHGRVKVLIRQRDPAAATQPQQQQHASSSSTARQATAAAIRGFMRHFMQQRGARVPLLPAVSTGHYLTVLPEQGSVSGDAVAGFWLQAQHVGVVLQELLHYWQQHVVGKQQQKGAASTAAVKAEVVAAPPPQQQQQMQGQQQQQPVPVQQAGQAAVAGQGASAMPQQQQQVQQGHVPIKPEQQQQQQQQQPMMQNNHMPHVVQQPMQHAAAGHVLGGR
jgi:hypothetical protein